MTHETNSKGVSMQVDPFQAGRVAALQPHLDAKALLQAPTQTTDPLIWNNIANVLRMWAHDRQDLPNDFCESMTIRSVSRQPVVFVVVEAERVARSIVFNDIPFSGTTYDASEWSTNDVFELAPFAPLTFPTEDVLYEAPLVGQEELRACEGCSGAGRNTCQTCDATGQVLCPSCAGTQQSICPRCEGAGTHVGVRGDFIQCQICRTRGYVRCTRCTRGNLLCDDCGGSGHRVCVVCQGQGNLLRRWRLVTRTSTWKLHKAYAPTDWGLPLDCLLEDCHQIACSSWPGTATPALQDAVPGHLLAIAAKQIEALVQQAAQLNSSAERVAGMRVRILGAYIYRIEYDYEGNVEAISLGGLQSRAFSHRGADRKSTLRGFVRSWSKRLSRPFDKPLVDQAYLEDLRAGEIHVSDTRRVVPAAAAQISSNIEVSAEGYRVAVMAQAYGEEQPKPTTTEVSWDVDDAGRLLLCTTIQIGPAKRRETFPKLLSINKELSFGRLAMNQTQHLVGPQIALVDRRIYETIKDSDFARILVAMASEARELKRHDAFK